VTTIAATLALAGTTLAAPKPDPPSQFYGHRVGDQSWQWKTDAWLPDKHRRVAVCETGHNPPNWRHDSGTYQGGYGFWYGTWDSFKPVKWWPDNAADATPWQQYRTALRVIARYGWSGWGCRNA
jgi:hypothetical protein